MSVWDNFYDKLAEIDVSVFEVFVFAALTKVDL